MSLYTSLVKSKWKSKQKFFDSKSSGQKYSLLNTIEVDKWTPEKLYMLQRAKIMNYALNNKRLKNANNFINQLATNNFKVNENQITQNTFSVISDIINSPFYTGKEEIRKLSIEEKIEKLNSALKNININKPVPESILQILNSKEIIDENKKQQYIAEKAALWENIVTWYIQGKGDYAITTGQWKKISDNNRQLVVDNYAFINENAKLKGSFYYYKKNTDYKKGELVSVNDKSVKDFIEEFKKLDGNAEFSVALNDELADILDTVSALKIQAKSGIKQNILNKNMRNKIALKELRMPNDRLDLLVNLYLEDRNNVKMHKRMLYENKYSKELTTYANYLLSKNITKTNLITENDVYFTEKGFETALEWMTRRKYYLAFISQIKLDAQLISLERQYGLKPVNGKNLT